MRTIIRNVAPSVAILGFMYLTFNAMVFIGVSNGGHADYIPYLNAPIRWIAYLGS